MTTKEYEGSKLDPLSPVRVTADDQVTRPQGRLNVPGGPATRNRSVLVARGMCFAGKIGYRLVW